jgi:hypothetical protein
MPGAAVPPRLGLLGAVYFALLVPETLHRLPARTVRSEGSPA